MFARLIVGVDGAAGGRDAAALAGVLADPEADIALAHVAAGESASGHDVSGAVRETVEAFLGEGVVPDLLTTHVQAQSVAGGLHRLAEEGSADLIVVGAHNPRGTGRLWSGDRTRATLRDAPCPVAVAPRGFASAPKRSISVIGVAYDDTREARDALLFGRALASESGALIHALWVVDRSNWADSESRVGWRAIDASRRLAELHGVIGVSLEGDVRHVQDALAGLADDVDLLILGSHHHGRLRRLVVGDTVDGLSRHSACPLLVMPHAGRRASVRR